MNLDKLNEYRDESFRIATSHGFYDDGYSVRHWSCLIISELMEAVDADRKGIRADLDAFEKYENLINFEENFERHIKDSIEDELADACIRIFSLAGYKSIDIVPGAMRTDEINPESMFTENILTIVRFVSGTSDMPDDLFVRLNYTLTMIFALAKQMGINIGNHIEMKMQYNDSRPYKHKKQY